MYMQTALPICDACPQALPQYRAVCQKLRERILEVYRTEGRTYPMPVKKRQYAFSS